MRARNLSRIKHRKVFKLKISIFIMRRFDWRRFREKGYKKLLSKDERELAKGVGEIKEELRCKIRDLKVIDEG